MLCTSAIAHGMQNGLAKIDRGTASLASQPERPSYGTAAPVVQPLSNGLTCTKSVKNVLKTHPRTYVGTSVVPQ